MVSGLTVGGFAFLAFGAVLALGGIAIAEDEPGFAGMAVGLLGLVLALVGLVAGSPARE